VGTESRNFFSLVELSEYIAQEISFCRSISEEYGERLGSLLRENEQTQGDEEWRKSLSGLKKNSQAKKSESKKKGKGREVRVGNDSIYRFPWFFPPFPFSRVSFRL